MARRTSLATLLLVLDVADVVFRSPAVGGPHPATETCILLARIAVLVTAALT